MEIDISNVIPVSLPCVWVRFSVELCVLLLWPPLSLLLSKSKGKAIPLQAWTGPEGSRRLKLPDFKTIGTW